MPISVIIIAKNEANNIVGCIACAKKVTDDIIVVDSGSDDDTVTLAKNAEARVFQTEWKGYGATRNYASSLAKNEWILAMDADERITDELAGSINHLVPASGFAVYGFMRQSYFLGKKIRFGDWGRDKVYRLYNKRMVSWDLSAVHEQLTGEGIVYELINGKALHYTVTDKKQNLEKTIKYATLSAEKLAARGVHSSLIKRFVSPVFNFLKSYIVLLGFLDGKCGYKIAVSTSYYIWLKYNLLHKLNKNKMRGNVGNK